MLTRMRCLSVALVATGGLVAAYRLFGSAVLAPVTDPSAAVTRICTAVMLVGLTWGWAVVLAGVADAWRCAAEPGRRDASGVRGVRRVVLVACGVAATGALLAPATGAVPMGRPVVSPTHAAAAPIARTPRPDVRVVHRGDCLWSIAASQVQSGAGPATITARWRALYTANRAVIGDDPDLIRPGQRLRMPR